MGWHARPRQFLLLLVRCAPGGGARVPSRRHQGAAQPRGPEAGAVGGHDPRVRLLGRVNEESGRSGPQERRRRQALAGGQERHRARSGRGRDDNVGRLLHPERGPHPRDPLQARRHDGHKEGGEVELPVRRLRQVVQGEHAGVPDMRVTPARLPQEAITGRCACT